MSCMAQPLFSAQLLSVVLSYICVVYYIYDYVEGHFRKRHRSLYICAFCRSFLVDLFMMLSVDLPPCFLEFITT